ncbi:MAG: ATP-binding protein [Candidatus Sifarchaeia archaeon]|jgi:CO dehydrogenase maturation factor
MSFKLAIVGKGGVGKTFLAGTLARLFAKDGKNVLAVDADPNMNLHATMGIPTTELPTPIGEMKELVEERTGVPAGTSGMFVLNPRVDDIPDKYHVRHDGAKLIVLGTIETAGSGCICPESALLRSLLSHIILKRDDIVIIDFYAGLEHLGRGTSKGVDAMITVVEPGTRSLDLAKRINSLGASLGVPRRYIVGNRISNEQEENFIKNAAIESDLELLGIIPRDPAIIQSDIMSIAPIDFAPECPALVAIQKIKEILEKKLAPQ